MRFSFPPVARPRVIAVEGQLEPETVVGLQHEIVAALDAGHHRFVIDLDAVVRAPLPTVCRFCCALRALADRNASVTIIGGPPHLRGAVELCAIDRVAIQPEVGGHIANRWRRAFSHRSRSRARWPAASPLSSAAGHSPVHTSTE